MGARTAMRLAAYAPAIALTMSLPSGARAAGGHHGVDDAAILEPRTCEAEGWVARARGRQHLLHAGAGCRIGPVELGLFSEYARQDGASEAGHGVQAKWATEWLPGFSVGLSLSSGWQAHVRPRYGATTLAALATWAPREDLALHLNLGRDFVRGDRDANRSGASVEWIPREGWSLSAERYVEQGTHYARAGLRRMPAEEWVFDVSRAQRLRGPGASSWTMGVTRLFAAR
jgi:hypothetical protein